MGRLTFGITEDLKRIVEHSAKGPDWLIPYGGGATTKEPSLYLVHDEGVYLMSASTVELMREDGKGAVVVYADGCSPQDPDWSETSNEAVGGDDFAELVPLSVFQQAIKAKATKVVFYMREGEMEIRVVAPMKI